MHAYSGSEEHNACGAYPHIYHGDMAVGHGLLAKCFLHAESDAEHVAFYVWKNDPHVSNTLFIRYITVVVHQIGCFGLEIICEALEHFHILLIFIYLRLNFAYNMYTVSNLL